MKAKNKRDRKRLMANARAVAERLEQQADGARFRIRRSIRLLPSNADGWYAVIGGLGKNRPQIHLWLDHFSGHSDRKLSACFFQTHKRKLTALTKRVSRRLWPVRFINTADTDIRRYLVLRKRLSRSEFNSPILEKHDDGAYFGIYDPTRVASQGLNPHFCACAVAFFEDVARSLPDAIPADQHRAIYPRSENRKRVASHLARERSGLLAEQRKIYDKYRCQVGGMRFERVYGSKLGVGYAEAHHVIPLGQLRGKVLTRLADLRTVCANCHRMLHRMAGKRDDIQNLKVIVRRHRSGRK